MKNFRKRIEILKKKRKYYRNNLYQVDSSKTSTITSDMSIKSFRFILSNLIFPFL